MSGWLAGERPAECSELISQATWSCCTIRRTAGLPRA